jgi:hypothetical protein
VGAGEEVQVDGTWLTVVGETEAMLTRDSGRYGVRVFELSNGQRINPYADTPTVGEGATVLRRRRLLDI